MLRRLIGGGAIVLGLLLGAQDRLLQIASANAQTGAKALFYGEGGTTFAAPNPGKDTRSAPSRTPTRPTASSGVTAVRQTQPTSISSTPWLGIAYWIELQRGERLQRIADPTNFPFSSGDRIRLYVQANTQGYLYVVNQGSSGQEVLLYPHPESRGQHNWVEARKPYTIPENGWIRFDHQPGEEQVLLLLSPNPIPALLHTLPASPTLLPATSTRLVEVASACGVKDLQVCGAKDLAIERDETLGQQATYVGGVVYTSSENPERFSLIAHRIRLLHH